MAEMKRIYEEVVVVLLQNSFGFARKGSRPPHEKRQSEQLVSWPMVEPITFQIQIGGVIAWVNRSVVSVPRYIQISYL
jgi:hypothetical protein